MSYHILRKNKNIVALNTLLSKAMDSRRNLYIYICTIEM